MTYHKTITVQPYNVKLLICVSDDPVAERRSNSSWIGTYDGPSSFHGLAVIKNGRCAVFFDRKAIRHEVIAHEIFHLTHCIMHYIGDKFSPANQEPYAYLAGSITREVYKFCANKRIKIRKEL